MVRARSLMAAARDIPEGAGDRQQESAGIEPLLRSAQNHRFPLKAGFRLGTIGSERIPGSGTIRAGLRCERESALGREDAIPLPAAKIRPQLRWTPLAQRWPCPNGKLDR